MSHDRRAAGGNTALAALLVESEMSNAALARAVKEAGAREGIHLGTTPTSVRRMLEGVEPRWPVPRLVALVLSKQLQREITITESGFADRTPAADDPHDGLKCSGTLDGTVRTVVELSGRDMNRRKFLLGSAFAAAAFSEPALMAMTVPQADTTARVAGKRVGMADVEILSENIKHLRRLDHRYGSGRVRDQVVRLLHDESNTVLHGTYSEATGRALLSAVAQVAWLAGSMAADVGRHSLAQRYYIQTLNLSMKAGNKPYAANVLSHMSRMAVQLGHSTTSDDVRLRNAQLAVALSRAGRHVADGRSTPALSTLLAAVEARAHALLGDVRETQRAVREAEQHYASSVPGEEPEWLAFYSEAELAADLGRCLRDTGDVAAGTKLIRQALDQYEPWRVRSRSFVLTDLALAQMALRDHDQAAEFGNQAMRAAEDVSSTRTIDRLRGLGRVITPHCSNSRVLAEFTDRLNPFLAQAAHA